MDPRKEVTRRAFLWASASTVAGALAGCTLARPQIVKETVIVEKENVVKETVPVKETVIVEKGSIPVGRGAWAYDPNRPVNEGKASSVKLWSHWKPFSDWFLKWIPAYRTLHPNVTIEHTHIPSEHFKKLPLAISAGEGPDIYTFHNNHTVKFIESNLIEPYPDEWIPALRQDYDLIDTHLYKGKLYYFDHGLMTSAIWYNRKLWAEAGLKEGEYPTTWAALTEVAKKLTKRDSTGKLTRVGFQPKGDDYSIWYAMRFQQGEWWLTADGKHAHCDTEAGRKAYEQLYAWYHKDRVASIDFPPLYEALGNGQAAMIYSWGWLASYLASQFPKLEWGVFRLPTWSGELAPVYDLNNGDATPCVNAKSSAQAKAIAFDFLRWLLSNEDATTELCLVTSQAPVMKRIKDRAELRANPMIDITLQVIDRTLWVGSWTPELRQLLGKWINEALINGMPPSEALPALQAGVDADIANAPAGYWTVERLYKYASEMHD